MRPDIKEQPRNVRDNSSRAYVFEHSDALADPALERALLCALISNPGLVNSISEQFSPDMLSPLHAQIYDAVLSLPDSEASGLLAVIDATAGFVDPTYFKSILDVAVQTTPAQVQDISSRLINRHQRKTARRIARHLYEEAEKGDLNGPFANVLTRAISALDNASASATIARRGMMLGEAMHAALSKADEAARSGNGIVGVPTGMPSVDRLLGGMADGNVYLVAGRPAMGKSALALKWATHAAEHFKNQLLGTALDQPPPVKKIVVLLSLEMTAESLAVRALAIKASLPGMELRRGQHAENINAWVKAARDQYDFPLWIEDADNLTMGVIKRRLRQIKREQNAEIGLVVLDHIHIVPAEEREGSRSEAERISKIANMLRPIAKAFNCPMLALAQLNRNVESRPDKRPTLGDLQWSGALEQAADAVFFVYRHIYYLAQNPPTYSLDSAEGEEAFAKRRQRHYEEVQKWDGVAELIVAKGRDAAANQIIRLRFDPETTTFSEPPTMGADF